MQKPRVPMRQESLGQDPGKAGLIRHPVRQGFNAVGETHVTKQLSPAEIMLSRVADNGYDVVVMGAYSRSRWRETILGGMTRDMLCSMAVPVLMTH